MGQKPRPVYVDPTAHLFLATATFCEWRLHLMELDGSEGQYGAKLCQGIDQIGLRREVVYPTAC